MAQQKLGENKGQNITDKMHCEAFGLTVNRAHWAEDLNRYAKDKYESESMLKESKLQRNLTTEDLHGLTWHILCRRELR